MKKIISTLVLLTLFLCGCSPLGKVENDVSKLTDFKAVLALSTDVTVEATVIEGDEAKRLYYMIRDAVESTDKMDYESEAHTGNYVRVSFCTGEVNLNDDSKPFSEYYGIYTVFEDGYTSLYLSPKLPTAYACPLDVSIYNELFGIIERN